MLSRDAKPAERFHLPTVGAARAREREREETQEASAAELLNRTFSKASPTVARTTSSSASARAHLLLESAFHILKTPICRRAKSFTNHQRVAGRLLNKKCREAPDLMFSRLSVRVSHNYESLVTPPPPSPLNLTMLNYGGDFVEVNHFLSCAHIRLDSQAKYFQSLESN